MRQGEAVAPQRPVIERKDSSPAPRTFAHRRRYESRPNTLDLREQGNARGIGLLEHQSRSSRGDPNSRLVRGKTCHTRLGPLAEDANWKLEELHPFIHGRPSRLQIRLSDAMYMRTPKSLSDASHVAVTTRRPLSTVKDRGQLVDMLPGTPDTRRAREFFDILLPRRTPKGTRMSNFCGYCGTPGTGSRFCTGCGREVTSQAESVSETAPAPAQMETHAHPVEVVVPPEPVVAQEPTIEPVASPAPAEPVVASAPLAPQADQTARPVSPAESPLQAPPPRASQGSAARSSAPMAIANPIEGVPVADFVLDAASAACLLAAFALPWDMAGDAADKWWVVLSLLVSMASLAFPYIGAARVVPEFTRAHVRLAKRLAAVPFAASLAALLINEVTHVRDDFEGGVGVAAAMGLSGVLLAASPRHNDQDPARPAPLAGRVGFMALGVIGVILGVIGALGFFIQLVTDDFTNVRPLDLIVIGLYVVLWLIVLTHPFVRALGGSRPWARVLATSTFTILAVAVLSDDDGDGVFGLTTVAKWDSLTVLGSMFLVGAGAIGVARTSVTLNRNGVHPFYVWISTARAALVTAALALATVAVALFLRMVDSEDFTGLGITTAIILAALATANIVASSMLGTVQTQRLLILGILGAVELMALIVVSIGHEDRILTPLDGIVASALFVLPALAVWALTVPAVMREHLGPLLPSHLTESGGYDASS